MQRFQFHRSSTGLFNEQQDRLVYDQDSLLPFLNYSFSLGNIKKVAESRSQVDRELLVKQLKEQYETLTIGEHVVRNLDRLKENNTFTITTGHQLSVLTGPLFFVIKILHTIKLAAQLEKTYPEYNFVPVYWMASEDHDFEEIRSLQIFNRSITWESDQSGPVGRFSLDEGFSKIKSEFAELFGSDQSEIQELVAAYQGENLASATRSLINYLFGRYGLIVIDGDSSAFKTSFSKIIKKEISEQFAEKEVHRMNEQLIREGIVPQVKARKVNLFYIQNGLRKRIDLENGNYQIENVGVFTSKELLELVDKEPESFSPNVVLRPIYQEYLLPNLVYVGGLGEIAYWLQLKGVFDAVRIDYPLIQVRNSVLWIEQAIAKRISKLDIQLEQLFMSTEELKRWYLEMNESEIMDTEKLDVALQVLKVELNDFVIQVDPGLAAFSAAEQVKLDKQIEGVISRVKRSAKSKHEQAMNSIELIRSKLFPEGGLQERQVNFFQFAADGNVKNRLDLLFNYLDPLERDLIVLREA